MAGLPQPEPLPNPRMSAFASCGHPSHRLWPASCRLWGASSPEDKLAGDLGNVIEATSPGGRRSDFFTAEKLAPGNLRLLQQYLPGTDSCGAANCDLFDD